MGKRTVVTTLLYCQLAQRCVGELLVVLGDLIAVVELAIGNHS